MSERTIRYLTVYVPARTQHGLAARGLIAGSGIVGRSERDAADRLVCDYPTTACASVPVGALRAVGTFDYRTRTLQLSDEAALAAWLGFDDGRVPWHERRPSS
jgi:hypothetical protein